MKDAAPLFERMRAYADRFDPHADALRAAADELERVNRWVLPATPEPSAEQVEEIGRVYCSALRVIKEAHIDEMRPMGQEIPYPC